jgi:hypothetical protein
MSSSPESSNALEQSLQELRSIVTGLMADEKLSDAEIAFLDHWLQQHHVVANSFPGNIIHERIQDVLADGVVTMAERRYLVETLNLLIENKLDDLAGQVDIEELWFDEVEYIEFGNNSFCLTGNFIYGPVEVCEQAIEQRGGIVSRSTKTEPQFLVVGGLGVDEWRTGGLGVEIETALSLRKQGKKLKIIPEDSWAGQLRKKSG